MHRASGFEFWGFGGMLWLLPFSAVKLLEQHPGTRWQVALLEN